MVVAASAPRNLEYEFTTIDSVGRLCRLSTLDVAVRGRLFFDADGVIGQLFIVYGLTVTLVAPPWAERRVSSATESWSASDLDETVCG